MPRSGRWPATRGRPGEAGPWLGHDVAAGPRGGKGTGLGAQDPARWPRLLHRPAMTLPESLLRPSVPLVEETGSTATTARLGDLRPCGQRAPGNT